MIVVILPQGLLKKFEILNEGELHERRLLKLETCAVALQKDTNDEWCFPVHQMDWKDPSNPGNHKTTFFGKLDKPEHAALKGETTALWAFCNDEDNWIEFVPPPGV